MEAIQDLIDSKVIKIDISIVDSKASYKLNFNTLKEIIKLSLEDKDFYNYLYTVFNYIFITIELDKHIPLQKQLYLYRTSILYF
jgi:hypothetical protein